MNDHDVAATLAGEAGELLLDIRHRGGAEGDIAAGATCDVRRVHVQVHDLRIPTPRRAEPGILDDRGRCVADVAEKYGCPIQLFDLPARDAASR